MSKQVTGYCGRSPRIPPSFDVVVLSSILLACRSCDDVQQHARCDVGSTQHGQDELGERRIPSQDGSRCVCTRAIKGQCEWLDAGIGSNMAVRTHVGIDWTGTLREGH
jgi:hypothetical protein